MTDIILIAVIVAFFVAAAVLVRVIDGMIASAGVEGDADDEEGAELESGSRR